ncbi:hypothetical protein NA56DRAFT_709718 [Hyaloscypha hepaticicola]|uniref:Uncharacterized protein n=1 Tax=Hyaloscypha hepaticicola TaxID=2082293 RepID=A0A2J6PNV3_9HELO|nr:hypothetical protein NA56DRAFT_709718 [Hyaloscypha hepaticicola]
MASSLPTRTVWLKLHPSARTFAERREVLRVLERFGEVTMFKSHKYNPRTPSPNTFLALFVSESAAQDLINASPIRYRLISNPTRPSNSPPLEPEIAPQADVSKTSPSETSTPNSQDSAPSTQQAPTNENPQAPPPSPDSQPAPPSPEPTEHPYQLHAYPSTFNHALFLKSRLHNPLHGPYIPVPASQSYIASSLSQNIPKSLMSPGLLDWETDSRLAPFSEERARETGGRASDREKAGMGGGDAEGKMEGGMYWENGGVGEVEMQEKRSSDAGFYFQRRQQRRLVKETPGVMGGLRRLREDFEAKEKEREMGVD